MADKLCTEGALIHCSHGDGTSLLALGRRRWRHATVDDYEPMRHLRPFGQCAAPENPAVMAATAAAGAPTPAPCLPATTAPWSGGSARLCHEGRPALTATATIACAWGGLIRVLDPGQEVDHADG